MQDFEFSNSTRIIFGRDRIGEAGNRVREVASSILLVIGSKSVRESGVLDRVLHDMKKNGVRVELLEGVRSNPVLSKVHEGIELVRIKDIKATVALGGGSVMDTAKAVAAGSVVEHDVWEFFQGGQEISKALPVITIPTLAASGSEMNGFMVITNEESGNKLAAGSEALYPYFSILDPVLTYTVPHDYTAYGAVDAVCHMLESYFNGPASHTPVTDRITEGLILSVMESTATCLKEPENYDARAALMWASSIALCGLCKTGVGDHFFPVHLLEHAVSALFPVAHGAGLAALLPGWMEWYAVGGGEKKICQFGDRIFGKGETSPTVVHAFRGWLKGLGAPVSLFEIGVGKNDTVRLAENAFCQAKIWDVQGSYSIEVMKNIYKGCV